MSKKLLRKKLALMLANLKKKRRYYCEVESLQNKTTSDYISTGIYYDWSQNATVNTVFSIPSLGPRYVIAGSYSGVGLNLEVSENGRCRMYGNGGTPNVYTTQTIQANEKVKIIFKRNYPDTEMTVITPRWSETVSLGNVTQTGISATTLNLFRDTRDNFGLPIIYKFYIKMGDIEKDFIPILDWDYHPCMYEKNASDFYYDENSSDMYGFTAGREIHYVDYIESSGTQYIDTGYVINTSTDEVEMNFQLIDQTLYRWIFGEHDDGKRFGVGVGDGTNLRNIAYGASTYKVNDTQVYNSKHTFKANSTGVYVDAAKVHGFETFISTSTLFLFDLNISGAGRGASGKMWSYKHKRTGVYLRDMHPAIDENGVGFMFDRVSHTCFLNQGTGVFNYPARETEYTANAATYAYIDLGVKYKPSMSIEGKYTRDNYGTNGSVMLLTTTTTAPLIYLPALSGYTAERYVWRRPPYTEQSYIIDTITYPFTCEMKVDAVNDVLTLNGEVVKTGMIAGMNGYDDPYESASNMYMFSIANSYAGNGKVYYLKITDGTTQLFDLIPAYKDGEAGFYNKVDGTFYKNASTHSTAKLTAGKIVEPEYE